MMNGFLCGNCAKKNNLSLNDRIAMSQRIKYGINVCTQCKVEVIGKFKPVTPAAPEPVQMGFFSGFRPEENE